MTSQSPARHSLAVLHPAFLLTGILHAVGGALLPSLTSTFRLNDSQSGVLFLFYFAGTSLGALLCVRHYARLVALGFALAGIGCCAVLWAAWPLQLFVFLWMGIGVGMAMSAINLFAGKSFPARAAAVLVLLNFSWSVGALLAPLLAARVLLHHSFRLAYAGLALAACAASVACLLVLREPAANSAEVDGPAARSAESPTALFAIAAFLEVGIENTAAAWLTTYVLRTTAIAPTSAASLSGLYWTGFLISRAASSAILLRIQSRALLRVVVPIAFFAATLLCTAPSKSIASIAMFLLGTACAPVYPLIVAGSILSAHRVASARWVLVAAGAGGSVLPWLTGWISAHSHSIRTGILTLPAGLLVMVILLPFLFRRALHTAPQS